MGLKGLKVSTKERRIHEVLTRFKTLSKILLFIFLFYLNQADRNRNCAATLHGMASNGGTA